MSNSYPREYLQSKGYLCSQCQQCGLTFWAPELRGYCGNKQCSPVNMIPKEKSLVMDVRGLKQLYRSYFHGLKAPGVKEIVSLRRASTITRYAQTNFMFAGVCAFQRMLDPHTPQELLRKYSGKLYLQNQFCYRFQDLRHVAKTFRHNTGFAMWGIHLFQDPQDRFPKGWQAHWLQVLLRFFQLCGIRSDQLILHQDYWKGGNSGGKSVQFFYQGVQIANMVFIDQLLGVGPRPQRILDLGIGFQRLLKALGNKVIYSEDLVYDHLRSLLVGIKDGALPSKVGIGYTMRKVVQGIVGTTKGSIRNLRSELHRVAQDLRLYFDQDFTGVIDRLMRIIDS